MQTRQRVLLRSVGLDLAIVAAIYVTATLLVLQQGFLEYNADGYTRIIHAYEWTQTPRWEVAVWLPLQTWLFGAGLFISDSLTFTPRLLNALFTAATLVNLYLIGRAISGRQAGMVAATLGALFPWSVWFGVSGMAEPLFHATLSAGVLGLALWLQDQRTRWLLMAATGLLLATMVRYEGWFYVAVFAVLIVGISWKRRDLSPTTLAISAIPFAFPLLWIVEHWRRFGDPLGFAHETAAIKESLDAGNVSAGLIDRLLIYPEETARLAPMLTGLCLLAACYAIIRRVQWWPVVALILGQGALLVAVSANFSNLGPGAERYLLSNVILLFPVVGAGVMLLPSKALRTGYTGLLVVSMLMLMPTLVDPPSDYPDRDVQNLASMIEDTLSNAAEGHDPIPVLLPAPPADSYNAAYALRILSGHPDDWFVTSDPLLFNALLDTTRPPFWVLDGGTDALPPQGQQVEQVGRFHVGWPRPSAVVTLAAGPYDAGSTLRVTGRGFAAGETVSAWFVAPDGSPVGLDWTPQADGDGHVTGSVDLPGNANPGIWAITLVGQNSALAGGVQFEVHTASR